MKFSDPPNYPEILESIQDGFVVVTRKLTYVYVNKKAEEIIGIPAEKLIGKKLSDAFPEHNLNLVQLVNVVKKSWIERKVATLEIYFKPLRSWYSLSVYPFKNNFSVIFRDITEEKQIKDELQYSKEELDLIFKNVSDGIVIQKQTGEIIYVNNAAITMGRFTNANQFLEIPAGSLSDYYDLYDYQKKSIQWKDAPGRKVLSGNKESAEAVLCLVDKQTGEEIWIDVKSAKISSTLTKDICAISIFHNVTHLKQIEQQKDNFLSQVSHELKTPLTILKVYEQILQKQLQDVPDTDTKNTITKINNNTDKIIELIHSLLDVSRIQEGKLQLNKRNFSLTTLLQEVAEDVQPITNHPIMMVGNHNITIYADSDRIAQVLVNLITNAIKYSRNNDEIIISCTVKGDKVIVSVKDFGPGIPQKDQKEIFKRFYQIKEHNTFPGLGLGLYISSEIIKEHGGSIGVKSVEGKGATFYFTLPAGKKEKMAQLINAR